MGRGYKIHPTPGFPPVSGNWIHVGWPMGVHAQQLKVDLVLHFGPKTTYNNLIFLSRCVDLWTCLTLRASRSSQGRPRPVRTPSRGRVLKSWFFKKRRLLVHVEWHQSMAHYILCRVAQRSTACSLSNENFRVFESSRVFVCLFTPYLLFGTTYIYACCVAAAVCRWQQRKWIYHHVVFYNSATK